MKRAIIILMAVVTFVSCETKKSVNVIPKSDTIKTLAIYMYNKNLSYAVIYRITKDTFRMAPVDSLTSKKQWVKDTMYFIPIQDTVRDEKGKPRLDSMGKQMFIENYYPYRNDLVWLDAGKNIDSLILAHKPK
jgi:hypothetical protein